jgi:hypothetical protein
MIVYVHLPGPEAKGVGVRMMASALLVTMQLSCLAY